MRYEGRIFRPPNEADAILLQATVGCSHNGCRFCGMYREKRFRVRSFDEIRSDIAAAQREFPSIGRVFLCDGDALAMPQDLLLRVLEAIRDGLPNVIRVATYANAKSVAQKSDTELLALRALNLKLLHTGLESGDDETLRRMHKHGDAAFHVDQVQRAQAAEIKSFVTVLLGLGGRSRWREHALGTAQALSRMNPGAVGALSLMLIPGTPLHSDEVSGTFELPSPHELLVELRTMVENIEMRGMFYANHASNYLPIRARLPRDRAEALEQIDAALAGRAPLRPEWLRAY
jgi:radical SAM superfamily enzyme YgiQ (UPF0313 family)